MQKVNCSNCGKEFLKKPSQVYKTNFCSQKCLGEYRIGNNNPNYGNTHSHETKIKIGIANSKEKNGQWKGDKVKYGALHDYIKHHLPKPELCQCCGKVEPYDLANKGIYDRNLENWEWLCRRCHMIKDGRLIKLHESNKGRKNKKSKEEENV